MRVRPWPPSGRACRVFSQAPGSPVVVGVDPRFVASGSIDGPASGTPDLAVANYGSGDVSVLLGNGDGSFVTFALAVGINPSGVAIGDLDFDGLSDLAVANSGSNSVTVLLNTCPLADLGAGLADTPDPVAPGADLTYTLTAQNLGPDVAMSVTLTDPLPAGTTFASLAAPAGWAWATPAIGAGGTITCTIGALPVGATRTARVNVAAPTVASGSTIQNTATIDGQTSDPTGANNSATTTTSMRPRGSRPAHRHRPLPLPRPRPPRPRRHPHLPLPRRPPPRSSSRGRRTRTRTSPTRRRPSGSSASAPTS